MQQIIYLLLAIVFEISGTTALKLSNGFTNWGYTSIMVVAYIVSFYFLSLTLRTMPVGIAYAIWSGVGILFITIIGWFAFKQKLDPAAIVGILFILAGVIIINMFSKSSSVH